MKKKVLILGGGFAGYYAAKGLSKDKAFFVTVIDRRDAWLYTPDLVDTVSGIVKDANIEHQIKEVLSPVKFIQSSVQRVDLAQKQVILPEGLQPYDILIIALGSTVQYYHTPGSEEHTLPIRGPRDGTIIKEHILASFIAAKEDVKDRARLLTFVVIGGGPTGTELLAEIHDYIHKDLKRHISKDLIAQARVVLVDGGPTLLKALDPWFGKEALRRLSKRRIEFMFNKRVKEVKDGLIVMEDGELPAGVIVWSAGMKATELDTTPPLDKDPIGRIKVDERLKIIGQDAYALGDISCFMDPSTKMALPQTAQAAQAEGIYLAKAIKAKEKGKEPPAFQYKPKGYIISLGRRCGLAQAYGMKLSGIWGWFPHRGLYLISRPTWRQRISAFTDATVEFFGLPRKP